MSAAWPGGTPSRARQGEDEASRIEDLANPRPRPLFREAIDLVSYLNQAAGIDHVIRRVEDATIMEEFVDARVRQLVIRRAADSLSLQALHQVVGKYAAQRARGEDVQCQRRQIVRRGYLDLWVLGPYTIDSGAISVGDDHRGLIGEQMLDQPPADLPYPADAYPTVMQMSSAPHPLGCGTHALHYAERGEHGGIPRHRRTRPCGRSRTGIPAR